MRSFYLTVCILCLASSGMAGVAQDAFHRIVDGANFVTIERTRDHSVLLSSAEPKTIARIIAAMELVDPVVERTKNGEEIITLTCFCIAEYVVTFTTQAGDQRFFIKHSISAVLGSDNLGLGYSTDVKLSKKSARALKKLIRRAESRRPNQPPQRNAGSRPSSGDSPVSETSSSLGPRG